MEESTTAEIPTLCWNDKGEKSTLQIYFQNVDFSVFITCSVNGILDPVDLILIFGCHHCHLAKNFEFLNFPL